MVVIDIVGEEEGRSGGVGEWGREGGKEVRVN
jgi:hypothetical protein